MFMSARQCGLQDARRGYECTPRKVVGYEDVDEHGMTNEEIRAYLRAYEKGELLDAGLSEYSSINFDTSRKSYIHNYSEDQW